MRTLDGLLAWSSRVVIALFDSVLYLLPFFFWLPATVWAGYTNTFSLETTKLVVAFIAASIGLAVGCICPPNTKHYSALALCLILMGFLVGGSFGYGLGLQFAQPLATARAVGTAMVIWLLGGYSLTLILIIALHLANRRSKETTEACNV